MAGILRSAGMRALKAIQSFKPVNVRMVSAAATEVTTSSDKPPKTFFSDEYVDECADIRLAPGVFSSNIHPHHETLEEVDTRYEKFFAHPNLDSWLLRKGINDLMIYDAVPDPKVISSCLHACRRFNEHSLAVRFLEAVKWKCGNKVDEFWPWIRQEITPTLEELGVSTPEELGYDVPELWFPDVDDMH